MIELLSQKQIRRVALLWNHQDARDHFEERAAITQADGVAEPEAERLAFGQMLERACAKCGEPHSGKCGADGA